MPAKQPDFEARLLSHILVGGAIALLTAKAFGRNSIAAGLVAAAAHEALDAPVADLLSDQGV